MEGKQIQQMAERQPFRPFGVRLINGSEYWFEKPRQLRVPEDYRMVFFFGPSEAVRLDTNSIVEIIER